MPRAFIPACIGAFFVGSCPGRAEPLSDEFADDRSLFSFHASITYPAAETRS